MAPLPSNTTARYWVEYTANGRQHEMLFRPSAAAVATAPAFNVFVARVATVLADMATLLPSDFLVTGARLAAAGSDVSLPAQTPVSPTGTGTPALSEAPAFLSFIGRTNGGRRTRLYFLGVSASPAGDTGNLSNYRLTAAESIVIATVLTNLSGFTDLVGIDGLHPTYQAYANAGYNAHWQKEVRS